MDGKQLRAWAEGVAEGHVDASSDKVRSISSRLLRFRWQGAPTVAVAGDAGAKTRIDVVVDGLAYFLATKRDSDKTLNLILGVDPATARQPKTREQLDAIGTVITEIKSGPAVRLWYLSDGAGGPTEVQARPAEFTSHSPARWAQMLTRAAATPVDGLARELLTEVACPALALYPKLSSKDVKLPWQLRLDGLDIGRIGHEHGVLRLRSTKLTAPGEPRDTWRKVVGREPVPFTNTNLIEAVDLINALTARWTSKSSRVLQHQQAEHALEAHILSGRLPLAVGGDTLRPAIGTADGALRVAQFPTLWGDVDRPARYLDALLADTQGRPWAVELKDQNAGGGHGSYLRHGITQAVLYRHYIRSVDALDPWFRDRCLDRAACRAALAFPEPSDGAEKHLEALSQLAPLFDVAVIQFPRP